MTGKLHGFIMAAALPALASVLTAQRPVTQPAEVFPFIPYIFAGAFDADNDRCIPGRHAGCPAVVYTTEMEVYNTDPEENPAKYQIRFQGFDHARYGMPEDIRVHGEYGEDDSWSAKDWIEGVVPPGEIHIYRIQDTPGELSASLIQGEGSVHVNTAIRITYGAGLDVLAAVPLVSRRSMITRMPFKSGELEKTALLLSTAPDYWFSELNSRGRPDDEKWRRPIRITAYDTAGNVLCDLWTIEDLSFPEPRLFFIDDEDRLGCLAGKETEGLLEIWRNTPYTVVVGRRVRFLDLASAGIDAKLPLAFVNIDGYGEPVEPAVSTAPPTIETPTQVRVYQDGPWIWISWSPYPGPPVYDRAREGPSGGFSQLRYREFNPEPGPWSEPSLESGGLTGFYAAGDDATFTREYQVRNLDYQTRVGDWSEPIKFSVRNGALQ